MATDVDAKLLRQTKFPQEFSQKVDMKKVNLEVMKKWIAGKISEILGSEDDVVIELCFGLLEGSRFPDIKRLQIQLTGFLDRDTAKFCKELWSLCLSAQSNPQGVPKELLEAKKLELLQEKIDAEKAAEEARRKRELEKAREREVESIRQRERGDRRGRIDDRRGRRGGREFGRRGPRSPRSPPRRRSLDYRGPPPRREMDTYIPPSSRGGVRRRDEEMMNQDLEGLGLGHGPEDIMDVFLVPGAEGEEFQVVVIYGHAPLLPLRRLAHVHLEDPGDNGLPHFHPAAVLPSLPGTFTVAGKNTPGVGVLPNLDLDLVLVGRKRASPSYDFGDADDTRADVRKAPKYDPRRRSRSRVSYRRHGRHRRDKSRSRSRTRSMSKSRSESRSRSASRNRHRRRSLERYEPIGKRRRNTSSVSPTIEKRRKRADSSEDDSRRRITQGERASKDTRLEGSKHTTNGSEEVGGGL
ncbi:MAG: hypothetical protein M1840_007809 [Geoglossum simile]|nr:MAG: hypothetical protein M1840_007809 [Geoglossum simile]